MDTSVRDLQAPAEVAKSADAYLSELESTWKSNGWPCELFQKDPDPLRNSVIIILAWNSISAVFQQWVSLPDTGMYSEERILEWSNIFAEFEDYDWFLANLPAFKPYLKSAAPSQSILANLQWSFIYTLLVHEYDASYGPTTTQAGQNEEEEEAADGEEEEEGDEALAAQKLQKIVSTIKDDFSYIGPLFTMLSAAIEGTIFSKIIEKAKSVLDKFRAGQQWLKGRIKRLVELIGLEGIFIGLDHASKKSRYIEVAIRGSGTLVVAIGAAGFAAFTLWRLARSPFRFVGKYAKSIVADLDIQFPEE